MAEALEAYRKDEPMVWYDEERGHKPEGIAVELVDGCIRILDFLAKTNTDDEKYSEIDYGSKIIFDRLKDIDDYLPSIICTLHGCTYESLVARKRNDNYSILCLLNCISLVEAFLRKNGIDPETLMREKHEYNKTRPYKHGKRC